jgi:hypothetical protein
MFCFRSTSASPPSSWPLPFPLHCLNLVSALVFVSPSSIYPFSILDLFHLRMPDYVSGIIAMLLPRCHADEHATFVFGEK